MDSIAPGLPRVLWIQERKLESPQQFHIDLVQLHECDAPSEALVFAVAEDEVVVAFHFQDLLS